MKFLILLTLFLPGCAGYQFGDATVRYLELKASYCAEESILERAIILTAVRKIDPTWVPVCTINLLEESIND